MHPERVSNLTRFFFWAPLIWAMTLCLLLPARPAAADPHRQSCGVRDDGLNRLVEDLAKVLVLELAHSIQQQHQLQYQPQYQSSPYPGGYGGYQPAPYGQPMIMQQQPMVIYEQPQYQQELGPVIIMPGQNQGGYFRQVSPNYYKIDTYPPLRLPPGARVLRPWVEGRSGVTLHLPGTR